MQLILNSDLGKMMLSLVITNLLSQRLMVRLGENSMRHL